MQNLIFETPDFVSHADGECLRTDAPGALLTGGKYRIDNPAATWVSTALVKQASLQGETVNSEVEAQLNRACALFGVNESHFKLKNLEGSCIIVKKASHTANIPVLNQSQYEKAFDAILFKRSSAPLAFCKECAAQLLAIGGREEYTLTPSKQSMLYKLAGTAAFDGETTSVELTKRANIAETQGDSRMATALRKLASQSKSTNVRCGSIIADNFASCIDEFDVKYQLLGKHASYKLLPAEQAVYLTSAEALHKESSENVMLDDTFSISRKSLMLPDTVQSMQKWASDQGYTVTEDAEDILDCVRSMPESLREEFSLTF